MNGKNLYKSNGFRAVFGRNFLISCTVFMISVFAGTVAAQFVDFSRFGVESLYVSPTFPVNDVFSSALKASAVFAAVFLLASCPMSLVTVPFALFVYGFSFSYALVYLTSSVGYLTSPLFYEHIISFFFVFPLLIFYVSCSTGLSSSGDFVSNKSFITVSVYVLITAVILSASVRSLIYIIFSLLR